MKQYMSVDKGLPKDDDRALFLEVRLGDPTEEDQFAEEESGMSNVYFCSSSKTFHGVAYDLEVGYGISLGLPLKTVTHWRYYD